MSGASTASVRGELIATRRVGAFHHHTIVAPSIADLARPGQLVSCAVGGPASALLGRRALPLAAVTPSATYGGTIEVTVDAERDAGMQWLAELRPHDEVELIGPLGRAFPLPSDPVEVVAIGVGSSAAAMGWLATTLRDRGCSIDLILGGIDDRHLVGVVQARRIVGQVSVVIGAPATLNAEAAAKVRDSLKRNDIRVVYAAGDPALLAAVSRVAEPFGVVVQCFVDTPMPCGTGLCGSCDIDINVADGASRLARCCTEGPVLRADRVDWSAYLAASAR